MANFCRFGAGDVELVRGEVIAKLKSARDRKREKTGKCEGRKSWQEMEPDMVALAQRLARRNPKTKRT
jgi:hypothetical protein